MHTIGCGYNSVFDKVEIVENGQWAYTDTIEFNLNVIDTLSFNDFSLIIRNNNDYHYNNFIAFILMSFPNGETRRDTVQIQLATKSGKWLGSGIGDVFTNEQPYINRSRFPMSGQYRIEVIHAMRDELLLGINDVGLSVKRIEN